MNKSATETIKESEVFLAIRNLDDSIRYGRELSESLFSKLSPVLKNSLTAPAMKDSPPEKESCELVKLLKSLRDIVAVDNEAKLEFLNRIEL